jgi:hypothetical protein
MASTIIGTYPIVNKQISSIDDNGVETLSYAFTIKTSDTSKYVPSKDDEYYGPSSSASTSYSIRANPNPTALSSKYLVTSVNVENLNGGLTQIIVNTAGTRNAETPPKIRLLPNYPLLFGLKGIITSPPPDPNIPWTNIGADKPRAGLGVMMTFNTPNTATDEAYVYSTLSNKVMPFSFRNTLLPTPQAEPFSFTDQTSTTLNSFSVLYKGFICGETTYQKIGGVIIFQLIYREMGKYTTTFCNIDNNITTCSTTTVYNYE